MKRIYGISCFVMCQRHCLWNDVIDVVHLRNVHGVAQEEKSPNGTHGAVFQLEMVVLGRTRLP